MVTRQLQVERRTGKVRRPKTDVPPLCHATSRARPQRLCALLDSGYLQCFDVVRRTTGSGRASVRVRAHVYHEILG